MRREEWRGALAKLIERQSAKACAGAGIAAEDICDTLGEYAASNLFGAAFEDLLATDLTYGRNIADDYFRRRGWKESVSTREYIAGRTSAQSRTRDRIFGGCLAPMIYPRVHRRASVGPKSYTR